MMRALPLAFILLLPATAASAATLGNASVGFSAERILVLDGRLYVGRMWYMPGQERHEQDLQALKPVFILHADSAIGDIVLPQLHTVVEFALPKALSVLTSPASLKKPVGHETVNGVATTRYAIDEAASEGRATGSLWLSREGIPMKCEGRFQADSGKVSTLRWELRHVKIGNQEASLFEVPKGFARLPPEAVSPLLGLRLAPPRSN